MSSLLLKGGRLIDPANGLDETADLLLADGKVATIGGDASGQALEGTLEIDVTGKVVCPGLVLGMQTTVVKPPRAAAAAPVPMVSLAVWPGSRK